MTDLIPRIDLRDYRKGNQAQHQAFIKHLGDGLKDCGFVIVSGHGIAADLIDRTYDQFKQFFALPETTKDQYDLVDGGARGYTPFGREHAKDANVPDLKEFWHIGQELPTGDPLRQYYPDNIWPREIPALKPTALQLYRAFENVAEIILEALADFFDLPQRTFADMIVKGDSVFRIIHYPPLPEAPVPGAVRAAAHEDINLITILSESQGQGLEILTKQGDWIPVNALSGDLIVDSGDMLKRVTNDVIPATTHRVVNPPASENRARYSMPFFVHPYATCDLTVMERFTSDANPAKWPPITAYEFLRQRLKEIGLIK